MNTNINNPLQERQNRINKDIAEFLAGGGQIEQLPKGITKGLNPMVVARERRFSYQPAQGCGRGRAKIVVSAKDLAKAYHYRNELGYSWARLTNKLVELGAVPEGTGMTTVRSRLAEYEEGLKMKDSGVRYKV